MMTVTNMNVGLSACRTRLASISASRGEPVPMAAPLSAVRLDIMNSAAGMPLSDTSATVAYIRSFGTAT